MNTAAMKSNIEAVCRELGVDNATAERIAARVVESFSSDGTELPTLQSEREKMERIQSEVMKLLGAKSPDRIVHDLRNVLNELVLLRALAGDEK